MVTLAVFFDFGGTLVVPDLDAYPAFRDLVGPMGFSVSRERYVEAERVVSARVDTSRYALLGCRPSYLDRGNIEILRELNIPDPGGTLVARLHEAYTSPNWRRPYPETAETLQQLQAHRIPIHVVSNSSDMLLETISRHGWDRYLQGVTFSQEVGAEKPDARVFDLALKRAGCQPAEGIHVGDSWAADYLGAKAAGLRAVWLSRDGRDPPEPCEMIRDLRELPRLLSL